MYLLNHPWPLAEQDLKTQRKIHFLTSLNTDRNAPKKWNSNNTVLFKKFAFGIILNFGKWLNWKYRVRADVWCLLKNINVIIWGTIFEYSQSPCYSVSKTPPGWNFFFYKNLIYIGFFLPKLITRRRFRNPIPRALWIFKDSFQNSYMHIY